MLARLDSFKIHRLAFKLAREECPEKNGNVHNLGWSLKFRCCAEITKKKKKSTGNEFLLSPQVGVQPVTIVWWPNNNHAAVASKKPNASFARAGELLGLLLASANLQCRLEVSARCLLL